MRANQYDTDVTSYIQNIGVTEIIIIAVVNLILLNFLLVSNISLTIFIIKLG